MAANATENRLHTAYIIDGEGNFMSAKRGPLDSDRNITDASEVTTDAGQTDRVARVILLEGTATVEKKNNGTFRLVQRKGRFRKKEVVSLEHNPNLARLFVKMTQEEILLKGGEKVSYRDLRNGYSEFIRINF